MKNAKKIISCIMAIVLVLGICPSFSATASETKWAETFDELVEQKGGFVSGINCPWFISDGFGNDIGYTVLNNYSRTYFNMDLVKEAFTNIKAVGYDIVKLYISSNQQGILFDDEGTVVGVEPVYKRNLASILEYAEKIGLYVALCINVGDVMIAAGQKDKSRWDKYRQHIYKEEKTTYYLDNWLTPIIEMASEYPNFILVDLYGEPQQEAGWKVNVGTKWERMYSFIKREHECVKKANPKMQTFVSSVSADSLMAGDFDDIGLDYYGYNTYDYSSGVGYDPKELFMDASLIYGEIGQPDNLPDTEERMSYFCTSYLDGCVEMGYKAAFFWSYGAGGSRAIIDSQNRVRTGVLSAYFWHLDREYARTGYEGMDAPTMMYSTALAIRFIGSRTAEKYRLERSNDKSNWTSVKTFGADEEQYADFLYELIDNTALEGNTYYYRVVAIDEEGNEKASNATDEIYFDRLTCNEDENLIKDFSFEENLLDDKGQNGWSIQQGNASYPAVRITDGTPGEDVHSGKSSYFQIYRAYQQIKLEENTDYTFTFWFRATGSNRTDDSMAFWYFTINMLTSWNSDSANMSADCNQIKLSGPGVDNLNRIMIPLRYKDGEWHCMTYKFNSGNHKEVRLQFFQYNVEHRLDWYLDDLYLFKSEK